MRGVVAGVALLWVSAASAAPLVIKVTSANVSQEPGGGAGMSITLSPDSADAFAALTAANVGKTIDIRVDGDTVLSAVIRDPIKGGMILISGDMSVGQLGGLAIRISNGSAVVEAEVTQ